MCYKIISWEILSLHCNLLDLSDFTQTRGQKYKLYKHQSNVNAYKYYFCDRMWYVECIALYCCRSAFFEYISDTLSNECVIRPISDELFNKTMNNPHHTLHSLLPPKSIATQRYQLRQRAHDRQLPAHYGYLFDCNFITRLLYTDIY